YRCREALLINRYCSSLNRPPQPSLREGIPALLRRGMAELSWTAVLLFGADGVVIKLRKIVLKLNTTLSLELRNSHGPTGLRKPNYCTISTTPAIAKAAAPTRTRVSGSRRISAASTIVKIVAV